MSDAAGEFTGDEHEARVALALASHPGDVLTGYMVGEHSAVGALRYAADVAAGSLSAGRQLEVWAREVTARLDPVLTREVLEDAERDEVRFLIPGDAQWPARLDGQIGPAPLAVWVLGDPDRLRPELTRPEIALLGTGSPSFPGTMAATRLAADLTADGYGVLAGGSSGIPGAAVEGTLALDGHPVLVLPGQARPPRAYRHDPVLEEAAESGVVIAELAAEDGYLATQHASRDRLLLPLADAVILAEAGQDDPNVQTAREAIGYGIGVGALTSRPDGGHRLVQEGVAARIHGAGDVSELLENIDEHITGAREHLTRTPAADGLTR